MSDRDTGLPASIEAAWGLRERPTKGPKPGLSLERIVQAAVRVAASDGLAAVTMSRVAAELGASTMALYRYVAAKDELLALMLDAATGAPPEPLAPGESWRSGLSRWAWAQRETFLRNPWVLRMPISTPPATPNQIAWLEYGLSCLRDTGLAGGDKLGVVLLVSGFVWRDTMVEVDLAAGAAAAGGDPMAGYSQILAKLADPQRFPEVHKLIAEGAFDEDDNPDESFTFGLERVLDGIEALVTQPH